MSLPFNTFKTAPQLKDLLDVVKRDIFLTLNCHALATVTSFDSSQQTINCTINYSRTIADSDGTQSPLPYPPLNDVPVVSLCGGQTALTFPIVKGDQVLLLFNDRDIGNWTQGATSGEVSSPRLHDFSDALAIVGLNNISAWDAVRALLTNGVVKLGINPNNNKVLISNGTTLGTILGQLVTALTTFSTGLNAGTLSGQAATLAGALPAISTALGGLLE